VLSMLLIGAAGYVRRLSVGGLMQAAALCTTLHLVTGIGAELWLGTFDPLTPGYRFAGTLHPNQQGINCGILAISAAFLSRAARSPRGRALATLLLCAAVSAIVLTRSRTALAAVILALLFFFALDASPMRRISLATISTAGFSLLALLAANGILPASPRALLLGRNSSLTTLTGRTDIWSYALQRVVDRPIAGYGYNSFWSARHTAEVSQAVDWKISEGHSAYLDTLLNLGAVGLMLFVALLVLMVVVAIARFVTRRERAYAAAAALVGFGTLDGLLESALVIPNLLSFIILAVSGILAFGGEPGPAEVDRHGVTAARPLGMAA
jgi:exopolysaccharide production protein ExoQ